MSNLPFPKPIWKALVAFCEAQKTGRLEVIINQGHVASSNLTEHFTVNQHTPTVLLDKIHKESIE